MEQEEPGRARGVVVEVLFQGLAAAAVVLCRAPAEEEEDLDPEREAAAAEELQMFREQAAAVERAGPGLEVEAAPAGRAQEAAEVVGRKEVEVEVVVLGSFPCPVGVPDRDQDWCPGPQEARPEQRHDRPQSHRPQ